jgi:hypothetical protein
MKTEKPEVFVFEWTKDSDLHSLELHSDGRVIINNSDYTNDSGAWTYDENVIQISVVLERLNASGTKKLLLKILTFDDVR